MTGRRWVQGQGKFVLTPAVAIDQARPWSLLERILAVHILHATFQESTMLRFLSEAVRMHPETPR